MTATTVLIGDFPKIIAPGLRKKVYNACVLFSIDNYRYIGKAYDEDHFPRYKYYTVSDLYSSKAEPAKKNKKSENKEENEEENKKTKKSYPIAFNKDAKILIDFIVSRFLFEISTIYDDIKLDDKKEIYGFTLAHISEYFPISNITELILHSTGIFKPGNRIVECYGLDKELQNKFNEYLPDTNISGFAVSYLIDFLKLICMSFTNKLWFEKTQTVNIKLLQSVLLDIEMSIPSCCKTASHGLLGEMLQYNNLLCAKPDSTVDESKDNDTADDAPNDDSNINESKDKTKKEKASKSNKDDSINTDSINTESKDKTKKEKSSKTNIKDTEPKDKPKKEKSSKTNEDDLNDADSKDKTKKEKSSKSSKDTKPEPQKEKSDKKPAKKKPAVLDGSESD